MVGLAVSMAFLAGCGSGGDDGAELSTSSSSDLPASATDDRAGSGDARGGCSTALDELTTDDAGPVVGCGAEVILREDDVNAALGSDGWSEDSGEVNRSFTEVRLATCDGAQGAPVPVVGAQVVELGDYGDTGGDLTVWEDVLVFDSGQDRERFQQSRTDALACLSDGDELDGISPDENFSGRIGAPATTIETRPEGVVLSAGGGFDGTRPVAILGSGPYYAELYLSGSFLDGDALDERGTTLVDLAIERLRAG
jgi:hypothetical protein